MNPNAKEFIPFQDSMTQDLQDSMPDLLPLSRDYLREGELSDLIAYIQINHTTFEISLKNNFYVLSHFMMNDRLFPKSMTIFEIVREHFGDVLIDAVQNDEIWNITIM